MSVDDIIRDSNDVPKLTQKLSRTVLVMDKNVMWQVMQKMSDDIIVGHSWIKPRPGSHPWRKVQNSQLGRTPE